MHQPAQPFHQRGLAEPTGPPIPIFRANFAHSGEANGGGFNNALERLRTLDLVDGHGGCRGPHGERGEDNGSLLFEGMTGGKGSDTNVVRRTLKVS